jgi:hypothetical protein
MLYPQYEMDLCGALLIVMESKITFLAGLSIQITKLCRNASTQSPLNLKEADIRLDSRTRLVAALPEETGTSFQK